MQKPAMFAQELKFIFLPQLIATYISYLHSMSPMARLNWSAFLRGGFTTLLNLDRHFGACGAHQLGITSLKFCPRPEWCPFGLVEWSGPSEGNWWPRVFTWGVFPPPSPPPTPTHPSPPPAHPPPCNSGPKLMHTLEKIV